MAEFKKLVITKKGQEAINDSLLTSNFLTFNKISSSLHIYSDEEISDLTTLDDIKQTVDISRVSKMNEETIQVEAVINNTEVKEGYALNSLGVYVNYKDEDILYGVASVESIEKSSYIPPFNEKVPTAASIKLLIALSDTSTIHFSIDPTGQATIGDILELQDNIKEVEDKIPTSTKDLPNESGYIDKNVEDLVNYELKSKTGNKLTLSIDNKTYEMTLQLKNSSDEVISEGKVDLPLETMVVNATYDKQTKEIVLTLQSGTTTRFSVADLVSGLTTTEEYNKLKGVVTSNLKKSYTISLTEDSWVENGETYYFEYDVKKEDIKANTEVTVNFDIPNQEKFTGRVSVSSYDGGFKIITNEKPEGDIEGTVIYGLTNIDSEGI